VKFVGLGIIGLGSLVIAGFSIGVVEPYDSTITECFFFRNEMLQSVISIWNCNVTWEIKLVYSVIRFISSRKVTRIDTSHAMSPMSEEFSSFIYSLPW
jgi:hypothetical protein